MVAVRLILLNGMPGIGKSTLADRLAREHPGDVVLDVDRIRRSMPGYPSVPAGSARDVALARAAAHLGDGDDVVVPQLVARLDQLARFEAVAHAAAARFVHVLLVDAGSDPLARFHRRSGEDPWHAEVQAEVDRHGGDEVLARYRSGLDDVLAARPDVIVVRSVEGDVDGTWAAVSRALVSL